MTDQLANHLRRKLAAYESAGMVDAVAAVKAKLADVEAADDTTDDDEEEVVSSFGDLTKAELLELAEDAGVEGRSSMNKAELIEALEALEG